MTRTATFSECRTYRYELWRVWDEFLPICCFIGLNPSTADETQDDPTIRRCIGYAKDWGYGSLVMLNLWPYRSTDPKALITAERPEGESDILGLRNYNLIAQSINAVGLVVAAWGKDGNIHFGAKRLLEHLGNRNLTGRLHCFGTNQDGSPKHPLYLRADLKPVPFEVNK